MAITRNARWYKQFPVVDASGVGVPYEAGMTYACEIRPKSGGSVLLSMTTANGKLVPVNSSGSLVLQFDISPDDLAGVPENDYSTDILRTDTAKPTRICNIILHVRNGVTLS